MTTKVRITERYDDGNLLAASIIAGQPERYQGGLQEWADVILSKAAETPDAEVVPLFRTAA